MIWIIIVVLLFLFLKSRIFKFTYSPDQMWQFFGLPGSGKTTVLADIARQSSKKPWINTFANFPLRTTYEIHKEDIGTFDMEIGGRERSLLILDESGIDFNNRNFRAFTEKHNSFFMLHRHHLSMVILASQTYNQSDLKLRDISTRYFYCQKSWIPKLIKVREIIKVFDIDQQTRQPIDGFSFKKFSTKYVYGPRCWNMFDSYAVPELEKKEWHKWYDDDYQTENKNSLIIDQGVQDPEEPEEENNKLIL